MGEDPVSQAIIERLLKDYRTDIIIKSRLPARGGQIKNNAPKYNMLGTPVILLTDLDVYDCPPSLINDWFGPNKINKELLFRIAQDEAESWLMADRQGFAKWMGVPIDLIPLPKIIDKKKIIVELVFPFKPSLYMMLKIASKSSRQRLKEELTPRAGASKGPAYNSSLLPFIHTFWNIENAAINSYSLTKTVARLKTFNPTS